MHCSISCDWLQLYVVVNNLVQDKKYSWEKKGYQTKQFRQVYEIGLEGEEFITLLFEPVSAIIPADCGIMKITNRFLYDVDCLNKIDSWLIRCNVEVKSITRCDIALDFNKFLNRLDPHTFIKKFNECKYLKIGQGKFTIIGEQKFENCYQYLRFGSKSSEVQVYLYNKTTELEQVQDKPYIRNLWALNGINQNETVWRLEISLKGKGVKNASLLSGELQQIEWKELFNSQSLKDYFQSYAEHYFHFVLNNGLMRKDRMPRVELFKIGAVTVKPVCLPNHTGSNVSDRIFLKKLYLLDQEMRGLSDDAGSAQRIMITEFINSTGLDDFLAKKAPHWERENRRPH